MMIKINLTDKQIKEAQQKHWDWFVNKHKGITKIDEIIKDTNTPQKLIKLFSELVENNNEKLINIICGEDNILLFEIGYITSKYSSVFSNPDKEEIKNTKKILPNQSKVSDKNWKEIYDSILKIVNDSTLLESSDIIHCNNKTNVKKQIKCLADKLKKLDVEERVQSVFSYEKFTNKEGVWNAYEWVKYLNLKTCPYCNRSFIHYYDVGNDSKTMRPDLDHFYPKDLYPFLGVSLFNLIPSCKTCNSSFKGKIDFFKEKHINPFIEEFGDDGVFKTNIPKTNSDKYDLSYLTSVKDNSKFDLNLEIKNEKSDKGKRIKNNNETFKIDGLYENHKDYVHEIIKKTIMYNDTRLTELLNSFDGKLFSGDGELKQIIIGNYMESSQQGNRVLSKLTQDIFKEFKLGTIWDKKNNQ